MKENREGIVRFEEISGSVMEDVLEFIYTGTVEVTEENAEELVVATNYLLVPNLKTISGRFIQQQMCELNCISTFYFAEKYDCEELLNESKSFIHANFASVADMNEFLMNSRLRKSGLNITRASGKQLLKSCFVTCDKFSYRVTIC